MNSRASRSMTVTAAVMDHADVLEGEVLDAGCGAMPYKRLAFPNVTGWTGLDIREGVGQIQGDVCDMPIPDESFDSVLCVDVLQFAIDPAMAVHEFHRVLKPGGTLLLIAPNCVETENGGFWGFRGEGLRLLLAQADFEVETVLTAGRQFRNEFENSKMSKHGFVLPAEVEGLIQQLDRNYPHVAVGVGRRVAPE